MEFGTRICFAPWDIISWFLFYLLIFSNVFKDVFLSSGTVISVICHCQKYMIFYNFVLSICLDFLISLNTENSENGNLIIVHDLWWLMPPPILFVREVECATCKYWAALSCGCKYSVGTRSPHPNKMCFFVSLCSPHTQQFALLLSLYIGIWLEGKDLEQRLYILQFVVWKLRPPATDG